MKLIVISNPVNIPQEEESLIRLFESGLSCFHLRKPDMNEEEFVNYLSKIPPKYYKQIVIHSHYSLIKKYNLKGIHFPSWYIKKINEKELSQTIKAASTKGLTVSTSVHSIEEIHSLASGFNYCLLSPVFDSISKQGYQSNFSNEELKIFFQNRKSKKLEIVALGGINDETISIVEELGFDGTAALVYILTDIQNRTEEVVTRFERLNRACQIQGPIY